MANVNDTQLSYTQDPNRAVEILTSAARTASANSVDFINYRSSGGHFIIDVTAVSATPSVVVTVQGKDENTGKYYDLLVSSAITATGTTVLKLYPGIEVVANLAASDLLPRLYRLKVVNADADSITYSITANLGI